MTVILDFASRVRNTLMTHPQWKNSEMLKSERVNIAFFFFGKHDMYLVKFLESLNYYHKTLKTYTILSDSTLVVLRIFFFLMVAVY